MAKTLDIAVWRYDRTQALYDGRVAVAGHETQIIDAPLEEIFSRAFDHAEFDVSELSFSNFLRLTAAGKCPYVGLPVFPSRSFRHSAFYVRDDGSINKPSDLIGRKVGVREFSNTASLAARGALRDQFQVDSSQIEWVMGDVDEHERDVITLPQLHRPIPLTAVTDGTKLSDMLLDGRIDAILAYKPIKPYKEKRRVTRLFRDSAEVEKEYFRTTGIFPIMHLMGLRTETHKADPALAKRVVDAFVEAQAIADADLHTEQALKIGLPWLNHELNRTIAIMGDNFWPNGLKENRKVIERMIDWSYQDGLIPRRLEVDELFIDVG